MAAQAKPLSELTHNAIHLLTREMGIADTMRFLNQFWMGSGDYTKERRELFGHLLLEDLISEIDTAKKAGAQQG